MQEREIVLDMLSGVKASIANYAKVISETSNPNLRKTFQQMRDGDEKFQFDLYNIASQKGYYAQPPIATTQETSEVKTALTKAATTIQGAGPVPVMS